MDKLLKLAAKGQVEIGKRTLIVVDEAGMLSTRQAHHILQLSERHGAKVVFAGDTRQQQPVEAGPGLRLIRDVAGSVRVDRIRRQKADLEDVLIHVHGETPEQARFRAGLTGPKERDAILADYEAMKEKPPFTPWQVSASEALRDGDAVSAIEAWRLRGRFHLCHDEEKTLTRLVEDWTQHVRAEPDASTAVLARTRAEARALSWLMREQVLAQTPGVKRAVIEVSRDLDGRVTEPLEIAVGDRLRIGATQWEKQLFNGTVVTVEDLEVRRGEGSTPKQRATEEEKFGARDPEPPSVLVTARTDDGRRVIFRHDEIRDYKDNIRLDYGYAMTIASAQGLTVDRAFLLADDRPGTRDHLSRRDPPPRGSRHLCQPGSTRLRHRRPAARGPGGAAGDGQRHPGASCGTLVALAAQRGGARLRLRRRLAGASGRPAPSRWRIWRRIRWRTGRDARGSCGGERQRVCAHRRRDPPCRDWLAPRRGRGRVRGGAQRGAGGLGRAS